MKRLFLLLLTLAAFPAFAVDLKADTATTITIRLLDGTDGITPETTITPAQADIRLWKEGGTTLAQKNDATGCTHREAGIYTCPLDATDTNTEGVLGVFTDESIDALSVVPWEFYYNVLGADEYDRKYGVTAALTTRDTGLALLTTITTATTQLELDLAAGASNNDAYNNMTAVFVAGTEECHARVDDYTGSGAILFLDATANTCGGITLASADTVRIQDGAAGAAVEIAQLDLDVITGSAGAVLDTNALDAGALDATAVTEIWAYVLTEPDGPPAWADPIEDWIAWMAAWSRNEVQATSTLKTLRNDADSGDLSTCVLSDNGTTFQRDECL